MNIIMNENLVRTNGCQSKADGCPLCGNGLIKRDRFGLFACESCGLVLDEAIFSKDSATALNEEAFGETYEPARSFWVTLFHEWKCRRYLKYLRSVGVVSGELLEVGVGDGTFLRLARDSGFDVRGCDLSPALCQRTERNLRVPVYCSTLDKVPKIEFDVVVMNHVVEHVSDPVGLLRGAISRLRPGGVLHVSVPNQACWEALLPGWNSYLKYHVAYYSPSTLDLAVRNAGFTPIFQCTHDSFSGWFLTLLRTVLPVKRVGESSVAASIGRVPRWWIVVEHPYRVAMILSGIVTWPLRVFQSLINRGDELIIIAKKN